MSRLPPKPRSLDICADCSSHETSWASINRGVLICEDCCSVHRSLGRHVSQVKSLRKGIWCPSQLGMVRELYASGANSIWEHSLLDPSGFAATISNAMKISKKKPSAKDALHPVKADFVRAKYQSLAFINRSSDDSDVSEQLHSSVRTSNLKTSLRLLAAGADPNYVHPEKGNSPIHVAANSGQLWQIELLLVYGADSRISDTKGNQAVDYAKANNAVDIVERLNAAPYELTDRLTQFVSGKRAEHETGQHYLVPEMKDLEDVTHLSRAAKSGMQVLPNRLFEELAKDVYDEVDRREAEEIWTAQQSQTAAAPHQLVPFLPVNPLFSSTRNQGRQKLARYNKREFTTLIVDVISDARRRQLGMPMTDTLRAKVVHPPEVAFVAKPSSAVKKVQRLVQKNQHRLDKMKVILNADSDSEPLYDSVPSDEESDDETLSSSRPCKNKLKKAVNGVAQNNASLTPGEYNILQGQLVRSDNLIQELVSSNKDMRHEITRLQDMVQKLIDENSQLRSGTSPRHDQTSAGLVSHSIPSPVPVAYPRMNQSPAASAMQVLTRPQSMYERGARARTPSKSGMQPPREDSGLGTLLASSHKAHESVGEYGLSPASSSRAESAAYDEIEFADAASSLDAVLPPKEDVFRRTEHITKRIQELLALAQDGKHEQYLSCSEKIGAAVDQMIQIFPETIQSHRAGSTEEQIYVSLSHLRASAVRLHGECTQTGSRASSTTSSPAKGSPYRTLDSNRHVTQQVIQSAYDIAKAAKSLVTLFQ